MLLYKFVVYIMTCISYISKPKLDDKITHENYQIKFDVLQIIFGNLNVINNLKHFSSL